MLPKLFIFVIIFNNVFHASHKRRKQKNENTLNFTKFIYFPENYTFRLFRRQRNHRKGMVIITRFLLPWNFIN